MGSGETEQGTVHETFRRTAAVILVGCAAADGQVTQSESSAILNLLETQLGLSPETAREVFDEAVNGFSDVRVSDFLEKLRQELDAEARMELLSLIWSVVSADNEVLGDETKFATAARQALGLTMEQSIRARKLSESVSLDGFKEEVEASFQVREEVKKNFGKE